MDNRLNENFRDLRDQFELVMQNLHCIVYEVDLGEFRPIFFEGDIKNITGYENSDFFEGVVQWHQIIHPEDFSMVKSVSDKLLNNSIFTADNEYRIIRKDGEHVWVRDIARKFIDETSGKQILKGIIIDLSATKKIESELRESEQRYKTFFNNDTIVTLIINPDTQQIVDANNAACYFYGWPHDIITTKRISDINILSTEEIQRELNYAKESAKKQFRFKHRIANSSVRDVDIFTSPIIFNGKKHLFSTIKDVTDKIKLEENLLQMRATIEKSRDSVFWVGSSGNIFYANESACNSLEYSKEEITGLTIFDIDPSLIIDNWQNNWEKSKRYKSYKSESINKTKSGRLFPVELSIDFISFEGQEYQAIFSRDITERKQSEKVIDNYKNLLNESQRIARIGSWELDIQNNILTWTDETYRIFDVENQAFYPTIENFLNLLYEEDKTKISRSFEELFKTGNFHDATFKIKTKDGKERWAHSTARVYKDSKGKIIKLIGTVQDITAHRTIEHELRVSEEKFSKAFRISPDSININSLADGEYLEINEGFTKLTGYTREDVIGKTSAEINIWANTEDRARLVKELKERGEVNNLEAPFKLKNGNFRMGLMSARIIEIGGVKCIISITRDIHERIQTDIALRESEKRFHSMFENNGAVMLLADPETGKILDANKAALKFYGYTHEEMCSLNVDKININTEGNLKEIRRRAANSEQNYFIHRQRLANGKDKIVEAYSSPISVSGKTLIFAIIHDINERVKAEEELKLRIAALDAAANTIVITNKTGDIIWANKSFVKLTGYSINEVAGKNPNILKSGSHTGDFYKNMWETINSGNIWRGEIVNKKKDGSLYTEDMTITPITDMSGNIIHFIAIKQDITDRKKFELELIAAKEKAEISEELKSAFLAQMSHEIRSPLYRILGYISLIKDFIHHSYAQPIGEVEDYFSSIDLSSQRLTRTIDSILNMSELQTQSYVPNFSDVNLFDLLNRLKKEYQLQANSKNLELGVIAKTDKTIVHCDEYSTTQIFANLIDNALKYTEKGSVVVDIGRDDKKKLYIEVRDSGIGISKEFLQRLFVPFTQEEMGYSRKFEGNGLGLALVKKYCELNNAKVEVKSEKGKGTTFRVTFIKTNLF